MMQELNRLVNDSSRAQMERKRLEQNRKTAPLEKPRVTQSWFLKKGINIQIHPFEKNG